MKLLVIVVFTLYTMCYVNGNPGTPQTNRCQSNSLVVALHQAAFQLENGCLCNRTEIDEIKGQLKYISQLLFLNDAINHNIIVNKFNISFCFNLV